MNIVIEDGLQTIDRPTGIGQYSLRLYESIKDHLAKEQIVPNIEASYCNSKYFGIVPFRRLRRIFYLCWVNTIAEPLLYLKGADVIHYTAHYTSFLKLKGIKYVFTVHDMTAWKAPETLPMRVWPSHKNVIKKAIMKADLIITPTKAVKQDIIDIFPQIKADKILPCCHYGKEPQANRDDIITSRAYEKYFLFVGTLEKRKNILTLIKAFSKFTRNNGNKDFKLILVGKKGFGFDELLEAIVAENVKDSVVFKGYMEDDELQTLYNTAAAFIMPSLYEGFGIPVLEAMALGAPVIASDIPVLREVAEDAAYFYGAPEDVERLSVALQAVIEDKALRDSMIQKGLLRAKHFTPAKVGVDYLKAYLKLYENSKEGSHV